MEPTNVDSKDYKVAGALSEMVQLCKLDRESLNEWSYRFSHLLIANEGLSISH